MFRRVLVALGFAIAFSAQAEMMNTGCCEGGGTGAAGGAPSAQLITWDPANKNAGFTLSNGNLTATTADTNGEQVLGNGSGTSAGQLYFEIVVVSGGNGGNFYGIAGSGYSCCANANVAAWSTKAIGSTGGGSGYVDGGNTFTGMTAVTGDVVGIAVDFATAKFWVRNNASSSTWNGGANNPAVGTETGGITISGVTGPYKVLLNNNVTGGSQHTLRCNNATIAGTPPSGYSKGCP